MRNYLEEFLNEEDSQSQNEDERQGKKKINDQLIDNDC